LMRDVQNPKASDALALRTAEAFERDMHLVGYVPRYLRLDALKLMQLGSSPAISVERVNAPPAPAQYRVLCKAVSQWPAGFEPFDGPEYEPLVPEVEATPTIHVSPSRYAQ